QWRRQRWRRCTSLRRCSRRARMRRNEIIDRGLHATFLVRNAGKRQRHLGGGQRTHEHAFVQVAEMADAEVLAGVAAEARAIRNVEGVESEVAERVRVA